MTFDAVVLLGFGGPEEPDEVRPFLERVLRGRSVSAARIDEIAEHYHQIGGRSPYNGLTYKQRAALERELQKRGFTLPVHVAFRNADPSMRDLFRKLYEANVRRIFAIPMTAFGGAASADRYAAEARGALEILGGASPALTVAAPFFDEELFVQAHASRIREAHFAGSPSQRLIFTAHSVPLAAQAPYAAQLLSTCRRVADAVDASAWTLAYQSRSGKPDEPWLEPDIADALRDVGREGTHDVLVTPLGFLCEHVEVLYDLDVAAEKVAREEGVRMARARALDDHPLFVAMLAELVERATRKAS